MDLLHTTVADVPASGRHLSIRAVSRSFVVKGQKQILALGNVDLEVSRNDFVTILGTSGCGKSTLLRLVAGLDTPSTGQISLDETVIDHPGADRGMVFQSYTLFPWLTVEQNICFGLREKGLSLSEQKAISDFYLDKVQLKGFAHYYPKQLSGGMQQRIAIARALANDPKILLLDEPFGALDHQTRLIMQELLLGIWEQSRKTVLFVTHDIEEALFMGNKVVIFSARPGTIKKIYPVTFSHPRHYTIKTSPPFVEAKAELTDLLRTEVLLADQCS